MPKVLPSPTSGASRGRSRRVSSTLAEINVIPLVDVMLVLLIIFMVAAPMLQKGVEVNLPVAARPTRMSEERLYVSVPATYRADRRVFIGEEGIPVDVLSERMRQTMVGRDQKEVFLRGDADVRLQELMDVMDRLKAGGVERVGIVAQQKAP